VVEVVRLGVVNDPLMPVCPLESVHAVALVDDQVMVVLVL
jgi:hypothetical protein